MTTTLRVTPGRLTDEELLAHVHRLARCEQDATASLVAHLAELDERRLHVTLGYSSLFRYCTMVLHLSEYEAFARIKAARAGRKYPVIFEMLAEGVIHLTAVRLLAPHLTEANHRALLARARHLGKREVERLVAEIAPKPDVPAVVRKLPVRPLATPAVAGVAGAAGGGGKLELSVPAAPPARPTVVAPLSPERYKVQFTASREMYERLQKLRDLLRHRVPSGDPAEILDLATFALLEKVERQKLAAVRKPRAPKRNDAAAVEPRVEIATAPERVEGTRIPPRTSRAPGRHIPAEVRRQVWQRDGGRCAYRSPHGTRCDERGFLEFHHLEPYAVGGPATVENIALRCRAHNREEAGITLGSRIMSRALARRGISTGSGTR